MPPSSVWTFFYGSFINLDVLKKVDVVPGAVEVATLDGFDICIRPLANLVPSDEHRVYGIVATTTHGELARLYDYVGNTLGGTYLPQAVLTGVGDCKCLPALCYIAPDLAEGPAAAKYVDLIVGAAKSYGFPRWYVDRIERFRP